MLVDIAIETSIAHSYRIDLFICQTIYETRVIISNFPFHCRRVLSFITQEPTFCR